MAAPLISVLMPAYNHEPYVREAVGSVLAQTHANLELIVIDDASRDGTWAALSGFADARLKRRRHETNQGAHATLNEALAMARGEYLAILDSDDLYEPTRLERLLAEAVKLDPTAVFIVTDVAFIDAAGNPAEEHPRAVAYRALCRYCAGLPPSSWFLAGNPAIGTSNFFFSRALLDKVGPFSPLRYTHDWDWALRALGHARPVWLREALLRYRVHAANTLSEEDAWRHIHENSYVQGRALLTACANGDAEDEARRRCLALLRNESLHPLSLLCFLIHGLAGVKMERLLALAGPAPEGWRLQALSAQGGCPPALFQSLPQLAGRERAIAAQTALIDERYAIIQHMSEEIAHRDQALSAQAALVEERMTIIDRMSGEIANRDGIIAGQQTSIETMGREIDTLKTRLERLRANPFVRWIERRQGRSRVRGA